MTNVLLWQTRVCRDKTRLLSRQMFCHYKHIFVIYSRQTNICHDRHNFVMTKVMSRQAYFCCDKHVFLASKHVFCHDTKVCLSQQKFCCDKHVSYLSWQKYFDMTKVLLRQAYLCRDMFCRDKHVCHDKTFVAPKMILVAAPANDTKQWYKTKIQNKDTKQWYKTMIQNNDTKHPCFIQYFVRAKHPHTNTDCEVEAKLEVMLVFDEHISPCNLAFISFKCWLLDKSKTPLLCLIRAKHPRFIQTLIVG